jgi:hypothetical protein
LDKNTTKIQEKMLTNLEHFRDRHTLKKIEQIKRNFKISLEEFRIHQNLVKLRQNLDKLDKIIQV